MNVRTPLIGYLSSKPPDFYICGRAAAVQTCQCCKCVSYYYRTLGDATPKQQFYIVELSIKYMKNHISVTLCRDTKLHPSKLLRILSWLHA